MVLPAQNIPISSINSELPVLNPSGVEGTPKSREEVSDLFTPTLENKPSDSQPEIQNTEIEKQPLPGKVDDLRTKKFVNTPIETSDKITSLADIEEKEFREGVDETAHDQHS
jgi:hypothetical protein